MEQANRRAAPNADLIVDANEAWLPANLEQNLAACAEAGTDYVDLTGEPEFVDRMWSLTRGDAHGA